MKKKTLIATYFAPIFLFIPSLSLANEDIEKVVRDTWACRDLIRYVEFTTSLINGRDDLAKRYLMLGACLRIKKGADIIIDEDGDDAEGGSSLKGPVQEGNLIQFHRRGKSEALFMQKYYAIAPEGSWKRVTGNSFHEIREAQKH